MGNEVAEVVTSIASGKLPESFWKTSIGSDNETLTEIYATVVERLQMESPDADTLELMMMERVCFLYIFMRAQEAAEEVNFDRTYQQMMSLWVSMAADLRKTRLRVEEEQSIRMSIVTEVARAIKEAMKDVDPAISNAVQTKLVTLVAVS